VRLCGKRVAQEDEPADVAVRDHRADLEVTAERAGRLPIHRQSGLIGDPLSGGAGRYQLVVGEGIPVCVHERDHLVFQLVVGDKRDPHTPRTSPHDLKGESTGALLPEREAFHGNGVGRSTLSDVGSRSLRSRRRDPI